LYNLLSNTFVSSSSSHCSLCAQSSNSFSSEENSLATWTENSLFCSDIDECHGNANPCGLDICQNTPGNFSCSCRPGYYMTNDICMPIQKHSRFQPMPVVGKFLSSVSTIITLPVEN
jgi:hypothetical protein